MLQYSVNKCVFLSFNLTPVEAAGP